MKENKFTLQMPLVEAMLKYKADNVYPLHTPGHKGGRGMERLLRQELGGSVAMDVSLMSELDDIHEPETYIKEAQELAAQTYGSDACFFAVNGTSQAIHAMLLTALNPGDKLLLPRNAHRSVAGGLVLGGIDVVYMYPEYNADFPGISQRYLWKEYDSNHRSIRAESAGKRSNFSQRRIRAEVQTADTSEIFPVHLFFRTCPA